MQSCSKYEAKTLIIARFGMLECGQNYKGTTSEICSTCEVTDNENHRLNVCPKFRSVNRYDVKEKFSFNNIYSQDVNTLKNAIQVKGNVWNTKNAHGTIII